MQDFIGVYKEEDIKQNLILVARNNRKKLKKDLSKSQLRTFQILSRSTFSSNIVQKIEFWQNLEVDIYLK
jgi:hypothetical protein